MNTITPAQLTKIHTLFSLTGVKEKDDKKAVIRVYTHQRSESSKDLTKNEAIALIKHLENLDPNAQASDKMRKKIISMAHEMGWRKEGTGKIDMSRVNNWCKKFGYLKKGLDAHTYAELPTLVTQFTEAYKTLINKL